LSFDLQRSLRRLKPQREKVRIERRREEALPFVSQATATGPELLLDTCVYIDVLQRRAPEAVETLMRVRLCNHSGVALAELAHPFGRLDPRDPRTEGALAEIAAVISDIPAHRLRAPSLNVLGEAGILAALAARLAGIGHARERALLNDATIYLQAVEQGQVVLTRNLREFDCFDQLLPSRGVLFYHQV
jgi:predicted nucleic acid-binding protein